MSSRYAIRVVLLATHMSVLAALSACSPSAGTVTGWAVSPLPPISLGVPLDDVSISSSVKSALRADGSLRRFDLRVKTRKGVVLLSGFVHTQAQAAQALALTGAVSGVSRVNNGVTLKGSPGTESTNSDDAAVAGQLEGASLAHHDIRHRGNRLFPFQEVVRLAGLPNNPPPLGPATQFPWPPRALSAFGTSSHFSSPHSPFERKPP